LNYKSVKLFVIYNKYNPKGKCTNRLTAKWQKIIYQQTEVKIKQEQFNMTKYIQKKLEEIKKVIKNEKGEDVVILNAYAQNVVAQIS
jgi:hypothetical protein